MILRGWRLGVRPRKMPVIRAVHRLCVIALHNYQHAIHLLYSPQHLYIMNRFLLNQIIYLYRHFFYATVVLSTYSGYYFTHYVLALPLVGLVIPTGLLKKGFPRFISRCILILDSI